ARDIIAANGRQVFEPVVQCPGQVRGGESRFTATDLVFAFKNRDRVSFAREVVCGRHAGEPGADHANVCGRVGGESCAWMEWALGFPEGTGRGRHGGSKGKNGGPSGPP